MTEAELMALAALVQQETILMEGENQARAHRGEHPAFTDDGWGYYSGFLTKELIKRKVVHHD